ncbi:MAG: DEAD/DEAH box helicase [Methylovulum sp.]|uniref:DEAD/DEAH box helicase n=1 Tax=Methylovulum sp. TaxID=1916980 RepID=UPI0026329FA8|nr:DEAD/DEAH box helicase [Methylovulum sp.]MDD2723939.1 DEAD/DEAH box helicase [Methylovulum sp.]MDD5125099.1 DEAD/DEAH box helicase [Methylovulum sp.]
MKQTHLTETRFSNLELSGSILRSLDDAGFNYCTPIQDKALPLLLRDKDIAGQAQTGTGKTATFLLATFQYLINDGGDEPADVEYDEYDEYGEEKEIISAPVAVFADKNINNPRAIILAPTRELAIQIHKDALLLGKHLDLKFALIYGGTDYEKQRDKIKSNVDIIIGTPGRIIDFYKQKVFTLEHVKVTVMDEADRMFDLGFIKDIRYLLNRMPSPDKRLNMLFSATLSYKVTELAYEHMNNPVLIRIESEEVTSKAIEQSAYCPSNEQKLPLLIGILNHYQPLRSIIFVNTKRCAELLDDTLNANGYKTAALSGDVPQDKRQRLLNDFQENRIRLLIATDVAARGLHIADVSHVFNYDLPQDVEDYVHRIGRTARFGASGEAISFVCEQYAYSMPDIEDYIGQKIPVKAIPKALLAEVIVPERKIREYKPMSGDKRPDRSKKPYKPKARPSTPENPQ